MDQPLAVLDWLDAIQKGISYLISSKSYETTWDGLSIKRAKAVWLRKPHQVTRVLSNVQPHFKDLVQSGVERFNHLLYAQLQESFWLPDYYAFLRASNKNLQLKVASQLGFKVPETLITSSPADAMNFTSSRRAVVKPIEVFPFKKGDKKQIFLTQRVVKNMDYSGLHLAPAIFQQAIDARLDIRVTVVGETAFAATVKGKAIDAPNSLIRDWRIVHHRGNMLVEEYDLPKEVHDRCIMLVRELGLHFGAIDLVQDKKGVFWFLENNANGQWGFVEDATKQPIGKSIAQMLMSAGRR